MSGFVFVVARSAPFLHFSSSPRPKLRVSARVKQSRARTRKSPKGAREHGLSWPHVDIAKEGSGSKAATAVTDFQLRHLGLCLPRPRSLHFLGGVITNPPRLIDERCRVPRLSVSLSLLPARGGFLRPMEGIFETRGRDF